MGRISALTELTSLASDDYLVVLDSSANIAKKITIANAFGITDFGWTATGESWTYSSWTSSSRIGVITVPTDATTKYYEGMRVKITQSTGGTKYGIIHYVTATTLHVFFPSGTTLNNEAITSPQYSIAYAPLGFPRGEDTWSIEYTNATQVNMGSIASAATITNFTSHSITIGRGLWDIFFRVRGLITHAGVTYLYQIIGLSTANNSFSDTELVCYGENSNVSRTETDFPHFGSKRLQNNADSTTYYLNTQGSAANTTQYAHGGLGRTIIKATSAYAA